jgi:hypothetical protein
MAEIVFYSFPKTEKPKDFSIRVVDVFKKNFKNISTVDLKKGLESNQVLGILRKDLEKLGFNVEKGKKKDEKIHRPVFFGDNGEPTVSYEIDAFHNEWKCGLEIEAGRGWMGNAVYRDLIQSLVMVNLEHLILAVSQTYKYNSNGKALASKDYESAKNLIDTIYSHTRFKLPYSLTLIGY